MIIWWNGGLQKCEHFLCYYVVVCVVFDSFGRSSTHLFLLLVG